jgi:hypothetical protein
MAEKLASVGLVPKRGSARLGEFLDGYINKRTDVKPPTTALWKIAKANLVTFFGADRLITEITAGDAKDYERFLKTEAKRRLPKGKVSGLGPDTARKRIAHAKQFFQDAVDHEVLAKNPFAGLESPRGATMIDTFSSPVT